MKTVGSIIHLIELALFCVYFQDGLLEVKRQLKQLLDRCASQPICASFRQQYDLDSLSVDLQFQEVSFFINFSVIVSNFLKT